MELDPADGVNGSVTIRGQSAPSRAAVELGFT